MQLFSVLCSLIQFHIFPSCSWLHAWLWPNKTLKKVCALCTSWIENPMVRATRSGIFSPETGQSPFWKDTNSGACSTVKLSPCTPVEKQRFQGWERVQARSQSAKELEERVCSFVLKDRNTMLQHIQSEGDNNWIKDGVYFSLTSHNMEYDTYEVRSEQHHANRIKTRRYLSIIFIANAATEFLIHMIF